MRHNKRILGLAATAAAGAIALAAIAGPALAGGPNMVTNGDFASNVNGWSIVSGAFGSLTWSAGHAVVTDTIFTSSGSSAGAWQCLGSASAAQTFDLEADTLVPLNQARGGHVEAQLIFYPQAGCAGSELGRVLSQQRSPAVNWQHISGSGKAFANTQSVGVYLWVSKHSLQYGGGQPGDTFAASFDNISVTKLDPPPPTATPTNPPPPQGSPIPTKSPAGSPSASPAPYETVIVVTTPAIPLKTPAPEHTPIVTVPGGDWPPLPSSTPAPKPSNTPPAKPSQTPVTTPPTKDVPPVETTPSLPEQHTTESSHPEAQATPLPPTTGSGASGSRSSSSVLAAGLVLLLVSGASLLGAQRRKR